MFDTILHLRRDDRFGVIRNPQPSSPKHVQVVGAVPYRESRREFHAAFFRQLVQRGEFGVAVEDGFSHLPGEFRAVVEQRVGAVQVEAQFSRDAGSEEGEAAGDERGGRAKRTHGGDEGARTGAELRGAPGALQRRERQALEHGDALAQGGREVQLAVHRALGDCRDLVFQPGKGGEFVQRLGGDDGGVHVRDEHRLAAAAEAGDEHVRGLVLQHEFELGDVRRGFGEEFGGLAGGEPGEMLAGAKLLGAMRGGFRERAGLPIGHQNDDIGHGRDW